MDSFVRAAAAAAALALLAACGGAATGDMPEAEEPIVPQPFVLPANYQPDLTSARRTALLDDLSFAQRQSRTRVSELLPLGTATYEGGANLLIEVGSRARLAVIGEVSGSANLLGAGDVFEADISNMHLMQNTTAISRLLGTLRLRGELNDTTKQASGSVTGLLRGYVTGTELSELRVLGSFAASTGDVPGIKTGLLPAGEDEAEVISGSLTAVLDGDDNGIYTEGRITGAFGMIRDN